MNRFILILGSNLKDKLANLLKARMEINASIGNILQVSSIYRTAPWGKLDQEDFLNQVLSGNTTLSASQVLAGILQIEADMGRKRNIQWEPRIIDIDILFFNDEVVDLPGLKVPHPRLQDRRFVLEPLSDLFPDLVHPVSGKKMKELLHELKDDLPVQKLELI